MSNISDVNTPYGGNVDFFALLIGRELHAPLPPLKRGGQPDSRTESRPGADGGHPNVIERRGSGSWHRITSPVVEFSDMISDGEVEADLGECNNRLLSDADEEFEDGVEMCEDETAMGLAAMRSDSCKGEESLLPEAWSVPGVDMNEDREPSERFPGSSPLSPVTPIPHDAWEMIQSS